MLNMQKHRSELENDGFTIIDTPFLNEELNSIRKEFYRMNDAFSKNLGGGKVDSDSDMIAFHKSFGPGQYGVWKVFQYSPCLYAIAGNKDILNMLSELGITYPTLDDPAQLRCDMPIENQSIFKRHQDYSYNLGSEDSVTMWTPLQDTGIKEGCLLLVPGSHKKGIYDHENGIIDEKYNFDFERREMKFGQSLIFNQKLVHQSGFNSSDRIRFSIQLRYSNLDTKEYLERDWYKNHKVVLQKFA
jgi:hypothetical protein